ncbi:MAG: hypothetical protein DBY35_08480 [Bacteroidales bacterium]|nr:MAG: hypothetical protein DBY35_08480 [Bacteroidales bacterium]
MRRDFYLAALSLSMCLSLYGGNIAGRETPDSLPVTVELGEVSVVARKPDMSVSAEKVVYTPSATLSGSSGSLYDAISSMPGVSIDSGGKISVNGVSGVKLMIDGHKTILTGEALLNYLRSLPSASVKRIEINSMPSARNDASGAMTTVDIVMNKHRDEGFALGFNGNLREWKAPRGFASLSSEYRRGKHQLALSYAFMTARNPSDLFTDRPYVTQENRMVQTYNRRRKDFMHNVSAEYGFSSADRLKSGVTVNLNFHDRREKSSMETAIPALGNRIMTDNDMKFLTRNINGNMYMKYDISERSHIFANYDFFYCHKDERQKMDDDEGYRLNGDMGGSVTGHVGSVDYGVTLLRDWKLIAGIKTSFVNIGNGGQYDDGEGMTMENLDSSFGYDENINAAYAELQGKCAVVAATLGVRVEQSNAHAVFSGNEAAEKCDYRIHDWGVFPNASINVRLGDGSGLNVSYARRRDMPNYGDLNPFIYIFDDITHIGGNIELRPEVSHNLHIAWAYGSRLRLSLSGAVVNDAVVRCFREISDRVVYVTPENLPRHLKGAFTVSLVNLAPVGWWQLTFNGTLVFNDYRFPASTAIPSNRLITPVADCRNVLKFGCGWSAELSGSFTGKAAYGQAVVSPFGKIYVGVRKSFLSGRASLTLFVRDLLNTNYHTSTIMLEGKKAYLTEREYEDMRLVGVSFSWRFKSGNVRRQERRQGVIDEIKRVNL